VRVRAWLGFLKVKIRFSNRTRAKTTYRPSTRTQV
jgi:hypothetical protein